MSDAREAYAGPAIYGNGAPANGVSCITRLFVIYFSCLLYLGLL